jgi:hypothetical protein
MRTRQILGAPMAAALAAASAAALVAGCGSSSSSDPLTGLSADTIASKAIADLKTASSVHVAGAVTDSGQTIGLNLAIKGTKGCQGSMSVQGKGSFVLTVIGQTTWIKPDDQFWRTYGGTNAAVLQLLSGKYMKVSTTGNGLASLASLCNLNQLAGGFKSPGHAAKGKSTTISGTPALQLTQGGDSMYVSVSASPLILRVTGGRSDPGQLDFTGYGSSITLTAPPAGQTIDGSKYGF